MDETTLRQLVRDAVSRHLPHAAASSGAAHTPLAVPVGMHWPQHASHAQFALPPSQDGACIVEPAVRCTHCGFCQSMGH